MRPKQSPRRWHGGQAGQAVFDLAKERRQAVRSVARARRIEVKHEAVGDLRTWRKASRKSCARISSSDDGRVPSLGRYLLPPLSCADRLAINACTWAHSAAIIAGPIKASFTSGVVQRRRIAVLGSAEHDRSPFEGELAKTTGQANLRRS
ncbi:MAG TPA: hypothetical protein VNF74_14875 [Terriglobales bacterium]|nr:hypothetical protein [Terriglobales bacterium]